MLDRLKLRRPKEVEANARKAFAVETMGSRSLTCGCSRTRSCTRPAFSLLWLYVNFVLIIQFFDQVSGGKPMCFKLQTSDSSHQYLVVKTVALNPQHMRTPKASLSFSPGVAHISRLLEHDLPFCSFESQARRRPHLRAHTHAPRILNTHCPASFEARVRSEYTFNLLPPINLCPYLSQPTRSQHAGAA